MINVLFFAALREQLDCAGIQIEMNKLNNRTIAGVKEYLVAQHPEWHAALYNKPVMCACQQTMVNESAAVTDGDEVAFFPPVTGG